jgi:hypothetical protein
MVTDATLDHRCLASQLSSERLVYSCRFDGKPDAWRNATQHNEKQRSMEEGPCFYIFMEHRIAPLLAPHSTSERVRVIKDRRAATLG